MALGAAKHADPVREDQPIVHEHDAVLAAGQLDRCRLVAEDHAWLGDRDHPLPVNLDGIARQDDRAMAHCEFGSPGPVPVDVIDALAKQPGVHDDGRIAQGYLEFYLSREILFPEIGIPIPRHSMMNLFHPGSHEQRN